jgi:protein gp37
MSTTTGIEWTRGDDGTSGKTWNPTTGCTRVSAGCDNCYAVPMTRRLEGAAKGAVGSGQLRRLGEKYIGLTVRNKRGDWHFNGTVRCHDDMLDAPLRWKKPKRIFVNSMSDLFHKAVPFEFIDRVFAVMALCPQHTFQVLTKRPERMAEYLNDRRDGLGNKTDECIGLEALALCLDNPTLGAGVKIRARGQLVAWPLPNVWLGCSAEDQTAADERIPHLLKCPAAVRFLSCEPLLGDVLLNGVIACNGYYSGPCGSFRWEHDSHPNRNLPLDGKGIHWVIVGDESGPRARPTNIDWIRSIVQQCKAAGVPVFVKQLGARPVVKSDYTGELVECRCSDRKGGDMDDFPVDLRVREFPEVAAHA